MATLANIFNQFNGAGAVADATDRTAKRAVTDSCRLRALPNEDVYFFSKRIDNSRVLKQADPIARARDWRTVGGVGIAALALIAMLLPSAYGLMAGYQLGSLQQENQKL